MKKIYFRIMLCILALCIQLTALMAQQFMPICGTEEVNARLQETDPAFKQVQADFNKRMSAIQKNKVLQKLRNGVYEIPVVIHVIHTGGAIGTAYNPSDIQLLNMIDYLNKVYAADPSVTENSTNFNIKFVLAKRTPDCQPTTGIIRIDGTSLNNYAQYGANYYNTTGEASAAVKALSRWPASDYYNIWIVNKIDGEDGIHPLSSYIAGYAQYPGGSAATDGTIMLANQARSGVVTLPHEIGHAFNLKHTFEGSNASGVCPANADCTIDGDGVCDTDPHDNNSFQHIFNPCGGLDVLLNFMSYSDRRVKFTPGQVQRATTALTTLRAGLISSMGLEPPLATAIKPTGCIPTITMVNNPNGMGPNIVKVNGTTLATNGGYTQDGFKEYVDKTCSQQINLLRNRSYPIDVTTITNKQNVKVYIDYNNDGIFDEATERIFLHSGTVPIGTEIHSASFTTKQDALLNVPLRMRVVADWGYSPMPTSCSQLQYGQAKDFTVMLEDIVITAKCINGNIVFTVIPPSTLTDITTYVWKRNGVVVGSNDATYTIGMPPLAKGDIITCAVTGMSSGSPETMTGSITIPNPTQPLKAYVSAAKNPTCPTCNDGEAKIVVTGGWPQYFYTWSGGTVDAPGIPYGAGDSIHGLAKDVKYKVTITDSDTIGCGFKPPLELEVDVEKILPVTFVSVKAEKTSNGYTHIKWQVADEKNVRHYIVERSINGKDFSEAGKVQARNISAYTFEDLYKLNSNVVYYRVRSIDMDGSPNLSNIVYLQSETQFNAIAYPIPFTNNLTIQVQSNVAQNVNIFLRDVTGRIIATYKVAVPAGTFNYALPGNLNLAAGVYHIELLPDTQGSRTILKVIKQ